MKESESIYEHVQRKHGRFIGKRRLGMMILLGMRKIGRPIKGVECLMQ